MHTLENLMAQIDHYAYRVSDHMPSYSEARAAMQSALTEVLAERNALAKDAETASAIERAAKELPGFYNLSYKEAMEYMTLPRIERGWSAVCVINADNLEKETDRG